MKTEEQDGRGRVHRRVGEPGRQQAYGIERIPTQIFNNAAGKELFRHGGFFGQEDILANWRELEVKLGRQPGYHENYRRE